MRTGKEWRRLYYNYVNHYNKRNKELITKYGVGMADKKLDYWSFRNAYAGTELARKAQQESGQRGKSLNVMRDLLNEQTYKMSIRQGRSLVRAKREYLKGQIEYELTKKNPNKELLKELRAQKKELNVASMRMGLIDINDIMDAAKQLNEQLKMDPNYIDDSEARAKEIGLTIFGSK